MTLRLIIEDSAAPYVIRPGGGGLTVPQHVQEIICAHANGDSSAMAELATEFPASMDAIKKAKWLDEEIVVRRAPQEPRLARLQIESLLTCNLSCSYCYSTSGPKRRESLTHEEVLEIIDQADLLAVQQIDFTGGEYLMMPGWKEQVSYARQLGITVTIHTNGTLITQKSAQFMKSNGVAYVQVSLDSHLPEIHDSSRGHRNALKRTISGLDILDHHGVETRISIMVHKNNIATIGDTIRYFSDKYPRFVINIDRVIGTTENAETVGVSNQQFWDAIAPFIGSNVVPSKVCGTDVALETLEPDCGAYYSYIYLTAEGEIAACPTMTSREETKFQGESIRDISLADAWYRGQMFTSMRYTNCENVRTCPAGSSCGGGCRSNAYHDTGRLNGPDYIACNTNKNSTSTFIDFKALYARL